MEFKEIVYSLAYGIVIVTAVLLIIKPTTLIVSKRVYRRDPKFWDDITRRIREHQRMDQQ